MQNPAHHSTRISAVMGIGLLALLLAGCARHPLPAAPQQVNRLVVIERDGNLCTMRPDGSDRRVLTQDASRETRYLQPAWSPQADHIAWVEIQGRGPQGATSLVIDSPQGGRRLRIATRFAPFYLSWSPDGSRLAYLSNWVTINEEVGMAKELALHLVEMTPDKQEPTLLGSGQPFYFVWSPDGQRLLTHIGQQLGLLSLRGDPTPIQDRPGRFAAPQWSTDGRLVYAVQEGAQQRLLVVNPEGGGAREVVRFQGQVSFALSPDGRSLAYYVAGQGSPPTATLAVADLNSGLTRELTDRPTTVFQWSPDGRWLAYLCREGGASASPGVQTIQWRGDLPFFRWRLWDGERKRTLGRCVPSVTFLRDYAPYFDQYTRSMTLWAPDSSAFAYPAMDETGAGGIWIQPTSPDRPAVRISDGVFVAWSPR